MGFVLSHTLSHTEKWCNTMLAGCKLMQLGLHWSWKPCECQHSLRQPNLPSCKILCSGVDKLFKTLARLSFAKSGNLPKIQNIYVHKGHHEKLDTFVNQVIKFVHFSVSELLKIWSQGEVGKKQPLACEWVFIFTRQVLNFNRSWLVVICSPVLFNVKKKKLHW
jgi:hypothetical protein